MKHIIITIMLLGIALAGVSQQSQTTADPQDLQKSIQQLQSEIRNHKAMIFSLQQKNNAMREEFNSKQIELQQTITALNAKLENQNQKSVTMEKELQTTNATLNNELATLGAQQKTLQTIQYPGLGLALILAIIVFLVLNRNFRKNYRILQADLSKFENQMKSSFKSFQKEQQQALNKLQTSIHQTTEEFRAFTSKAEGHHKQMRQDFEALLSRHTLEEDEKLKNKIEPIDNRLVDINKHFKKYDSKLQELNKKVDSQAEPDK